METNKHRVNAVVLAACIGGLLLVGGRALGREGHTIRGSYSIISTKPVKVGNRRQLLMDDYVVEDIRNCRRTVHQPTKHAANPLFSTGPAGPEEDEAFGTVSVLHDREHGLYRLWAVHSATVQQSTPPGFYWDSRGAYHRSKDGNHWETPELLNRGEGPILNNVVLGPPDRSQHSISVIETPDKWRHRGRFLMVYFIGPVGRGPHPGLIAGGQELRIAFSDDGIHWRDQKENPIFAGQSDTENNICYNPDRKVFMLYRRPPIHAGEIRRIAYSQSADLIHWTQPRHIIVADELDPYSLYGMTVVRYQGVYFGFLQLFYSRNSNREKHMMVDVQLAWSRDGIHWQRHPERPTFLATGPKHSYDAGMVFLGKGLIKRGDHIDLYYAGHENLHISMVPGESSLCLASLRKDGFTSLDAPQEGSVLTKPIECPGGKLHINAKTARGGSIRVAIRRGDGEFDGLRPPEWDYEQARAIAGDSTDHFVTWKGQENLNALKGKAIRLEFKLEQAELFSFWFQD